MPPRFPRIIVRLRMVPLESGSRLFMSIHCFIRVHITSMMFVVMIPIVNKTPPVLKDVNIIINPLDITTHV